MSKNRNIVIYFVCVSLFCFLPNLSMAQEEDPENMYWLEDSILTRQLDTVDTEDVLTMLRNGLDNAISFCQGTEDFINKDSVESWVTLIRWSVIMKDGESLNKIRELNNCVNEGDKGHWQFYLSYMTRWGVYFDETDGFSQSQILDLILPYLFDEEEMNVIFYEERLIDLGPGAIPEVLAWAQENIIPRMDELDMVMRSAEDLKFTEQYDRFATIFAMLFQSEEDKMVLIEMNESGDEKERRFAMDVLGVIEF